LDQTGFNPFGIGVPAMGGAAGKVSAKALMNALKAGELPKGEVVPGKANLPTIGALADAEAGMPYTHPVKLGAKGLSSVKHASGVELPKSQAQMIANFETAGYPSKPVVSPTSGNVVGTQYTLPDGSRVRVMQADGRSPQRASFENANGGPIDPTTGKPPQPPKGLSKAERKQWIRERTHIEQVD
ncbi:hypothetical protein OH115_30990, partial [Pseudomonas aeruginosa]